MCSKSGVEMSSSMYVGDIRVVLLVIWLLPSLVTAFLTVGSCSIQTSDSGVVGSPRFKNRPVRNMVYSCMANNNCNYAVHVVGNYEADNRHSFNYHPTGNSDVYLTVGGNDSRPLMLVLSSYEPVLWRLHIPTGVVLSKVIVSSSLNSSVSYNHEQVLQVENRLRYYAYGSDSGGGQTLQLLQNLMQRLGPVTSFTGTYQADEWRLNINRETPDLSCMTTPNESEDISTEKGLNEHSIIPVLYGVIGATSLLSILLIALLIGVICAAYMCFWKKRTCIPIPPPTYDDSHSINCNYFYPQTDPSLPKYSDITAI